MSLICWYPFNGDIKNYGLSEVESHKIKSFQDGKLGKCAEVNNTGDSIFVKELKDKKIFSFSLFGKFASDSATWGDFITFWVTKLLQKI